LRSDYVNGTNGSGSNTSKQRWIFPKRLELSSGDFKGKRVDMVRTGETTTERTLIRTIAGASRPLDKDLGLSTLQAIDRLQKLSEKFREQWIRPSPWLVLEDSWTLPASMPVAKMLEDMQTHGGPIGIVGMCLLKYSQRYAVLKMLFRKDQKSRKTVEESERAAMEHLMAYVQHIPKLNEGTKDKG
jgi:hypothetical protein